MSMPSLVSTKNDMLVRVFVIILGLESNFTVFQLQTRTKSAYLEM
jgi:hypothetical protein